MSHISTSPAHSIRSRNIFTAICTDGAFKDGIYIFPILFLLLIGLFVVIYNIQHVPPGPKANQGSYVIRLLTQFLPLCEGDFLS